MKQGVYFQVELTFLGLNDYDNISKKQPLEFGIITFK